MQAARLKLWEDSFLAACVIFSFWTVYVFFLQGFLTIALLNEAIAATSSTMIGLSFSLSGLCYYFDFLDSKIAYRKYFGLIGFWLAFLYAILLVVLHPERYFYRFALNFWSPDFLLGLSALTIFAGMTAISTNWAMTRLGVLWWRRILHLGYLAYFFLIVRAVIVDGGNWLVWLNSFSGLPPLRLLGAVFAVSVLLFRLSIVIADWRKKQTVHETL